MAQEDALYRSRYQLISDTKQWQAFGYVFTRWSQRDIAKVFNDIDLWLAPGAWQRRGPRSRQTAAPIRAEGGAGCLRTGRARGSCPVRSEWPRPPPSAPAGQDGYGDYVQGERCPGVLCASYKHKRPPLWCPRSARLRSPSVAGPGRRRSPGRPRPHWPTRAAPASPTPPPRPRIFVDQVAAGTSFGAKEREYYSKIVDYIKSYGKLVCAVRPPAGRHPAAARPADPAKPAHCKQRGSIALHPQPCPTAGSHMELPLASHSTE